MPCHKDSHGDELISGRSARSEPSLPRAPRARPGPGQPRQPMQRHIQLEPMSMAMAMAPQPMAWCRDIMSFPEEGPKVAWGSPVGHGWRMLDSKKGWDEVGLSVEGP